MCAAPRTFYDKLWDSHVISDLGEGDALILVDRLTLAETNGGLALAELKKEGRRPMNPAHVFSILDHIVETMPGRGPNDAGLAKFAPLIPEFRDLSKEFGCHFFDVGDRRQGITHVVAPELGIALPGMTVAGSDSHSCTLGGVGALGWGIGTSETKTILATQARVARKLKSMRVTFNGTLRPGVYAKDLVLYLIGQIGVKAGAGHVVEYDGTAMPSIGVEGRLTLCNMGVEFGADAAIVAPDDVTVDYMRGREYAPTGEKWDAAVAYWRTLKSDPGAKFDREVVIDVSKIGPQVSWGTSVQHMISLDEKVPDPSTQSDAFERDQAQVALGYTGLKVGQSLVGVPIEGAYIGSCTNARLSDLREAAAILKGRKVAPGVLAMCIPGSTPVKLAAEAEGIDKIFRDAGFEWHESGCGYCGATSGERYAKMRVISSTNRNYADRQSKGAITHIASPATVAASAVTGRITDPRSMKQ